MSKSTLAGCPTEILYTICSAVYAAGLPAAITSLDPLVSIDSPPPTSLPSSLPPGNWTEPLARKTLASLCLVNRACYDAAKPWLWRKIEVRLPRSWLSLVEELSDEDVVSSLVPQEVASIPLVAALTGSETKDACGPDGPIWPDMTVPPELLSPPASRDPSPARMRAKSPGRWRFLEAVNNAVDNSEPGLYVPTPDDPRPGRHVQHIDFNHFRTIGMRRYVGEGVSSRFVTGERVERILKEMPNLLTFGATEYMDGALTLPVLVELLCRGQWGREEDDRAPRSRERGRGPVADESVEDDKRRRQASTALEALDLCGCVSAVFVNALQEFVSTHIPDDPEDPVTFPGLRRLSMRGVTSLPPSVLTPFVLAFPSLTHLDLSGTRCTPELLEALSDSPTVQLEALALSRCTRLTSESIASFLIEAPCAQSIVHLSLYGDATFPSPLIADDLQRIIMEAPCFRSGELAYLDLSANPVTPAHLDAFAAQPALRSLGLSHISALPISAITRFVRELASNLEILTLVGTSPELGVGVAAREIALTLHSKVIRPLCTPPFKIMHSASTPVSPPPTRLRVIELQATTLHALGAGAGSWRVVRSKGGRAWYVDVASGWTAVSGSEAVLRRDLPANHPLRIEFERLADSNGNVSSGVGWHARKMEVLHGQGMLGREDGLYGAVSFAYSG